LLRIAINRETPVFIGLSKPAALTQLDATTQNRKTGQELAKQKDGLFDDVGSKGHFFGIWTTRDGPNQLNFEC
jgi:hypothetical protein